MDIVILVVSAAAVFTVGYTVFWTVRAVRRVGLGRFARALGALVWAMLVACVKLIKPSRHPSRAGTTGADDAFDLMDDFRIAQESIARPSWRHA
ncbi:MAG: hypothetical protein ACREVY_17925 [Gammaproteobacteria bacterium]